MGDSQLPGRLVCPACQKELGEGDCLSCDMVKGFVGDQNPDRRKPQAIEAAKTLLESQALQENLLRGGNGNLHQEEEWQTICRETREGIFRRYKDRLRKKAEDLRRDGGSEKSGK